LKAKVIECPPLRRKTGGGSADGCNHPVASRHPSLKRRGEIFFLPLLPEEGWLRSRRGGGSLPEEVYDAARDGVVEVGRNGPSLVIMYFKGYMNNP
jgi:hypothetical protein